MSEWPLCRDMYLNGLSTHTTLLVFQNDWLLYVFLVTISLFIGWRPDSQTICANHIWFASLSSLRSFFEPPWWKYRRRQPYVPTTYEWRVCPSILFSPTGEWQTSPTICAGHISIAGLSGIRFWTSRIIVYVGQTSPSLCGQHTLVASLAFTRAIFSLSLTSIWYSFLFSVFTTGIMRGLL
jgi:hypothetical protein